MATEQIGSLIPTAIPGYEDAADIQAALRAYHYGSYDYSTANTNPVNLVSPSIAKTIYDIESAITTLENKPSGGGIVDADEPVPGDFPDNEIPEGYIWVDSNGTLGGAPISATSVYTNEAPTVDLTSGLIWVDKDSSAAFENPYIPQSIIGSKGDLVVGSANDQVTVLPASTNGYALFTNSSTTSGLEWSNIYSGAILKGPEERWSVLSSAATGTVNLDFLTSGILYYTSNSTGNWTLNVRGNSTTSLNDVLAVNDSVTVVFFATNGTTPYYGTSFSIDGNVIVPKWQNGVAPSSGNASSIDIYSFTIIKTGNAAFTAFGSQTKFA